MNEDQRKHLEFLQNSITRTNSNSFQIKGLSITITAAMLSIYASNSKALIIFMAIPPTILFLFVDAYYLQLERRLRGIYKDAAGITNRVVVETYDFPLDKYRKGKYRFINAIMSRTVFPLYISIISFLIVLGVYVTMGSHSCS